MIEPDVVKLYRVCVMVFFAVLVGGAAAVGVLYLCGVRI